MKEIFNPVIIREIETDYLVSTFGRIYSKHRDKFLKPSISNCGYERVTLYVNKIPTKFSIHRLVALAFIPNPENKPQVNHINGVKTDNHVTNLEWVSESENDYHAYKTGLKVAKHGDESHFAKYSKETVERSCELMEEGLLTIYDISKLTKISSDMLYLIKKRLSWTNVSYKYEVENCPDVKNHYTLIQIEVVFKLLEEDELSLYDISDISGVKVSTINNILVHRHVKKYEFLYDLYDVSNYHKNKIMPKFPDDAISDIHNMLKSGLSNKEISKEVSEKYHLSEDRVRHYTNRIRKKQISDATGSTTNERISIIDIIE